ncbi:spermatogenesis-defective protein 39 -like, partial [Asbolus verrucosus]
MFLGEHFLLNMYRTLEDKLLLLDSALDIGDGNVILTKDIYYLLSKDITNQEVLYKKLEQFNVHHAQNLYSVEDKMEVEENMSFIEFQVKNRSNYNSVIDQLIDLSKTEWQKGNGDEITSQLRRQFKLDDIQYDWIIMSVLCKLKYWDKLLTTFTKTVWVIKKRALKSTMKPPLFIVGVGRHNPPKHVMEQFLLCMGDASKSLYLAEKLKMHSYIINYYIEQKDKTSLLKYTEKIEPGDEAMVAIHSALNN